VQWNSYVTDNDNFAFAGSPSSFARSNDGFGGGVQVGWNWQYHCSVWGVVADWSWSNLHNDTAIRPDFTGAAGPGTVFNQGNLQSQLQWYGTVRGKAGIVVDNVMLYMTGGFAWAQMKNHWSMAFAVPGTGIASTVDFDNSDRWGFAGGVGAEWAYTPNFSIFTEVLYMSFQKKDYSQRENLAIVGGGAGTFGFCPPFTPRTPGVCAFQSGDNIFLARVGANWHFNWGLPVYARY
jgi:outer membrane immunogenic protein